MHVIHSHSPQHPVLIARARRRGGGGRGSSLCGRGVGGSRGLRLYHNSGLGRNRLRSGCYLLHVVQA